MVVSLETSFSLVRLGLGVDVKGLILPIRTFLVSLLDAHRAKLSALVSCFFNPKVIQQEVVGNCT